MAPNFNSLLVVATLICIAASIESLTQNPCNNKHTCHDCIQTQNCAWCEKPDIGGRPRCFMEGFATNCPEWFIVNPDGVETVILNKEPIRGTVNRKKVQISPQHVDLKLRINQPHRLQIRYSQTEDYPVDVYYLVDLSNSTEDDRKNFSTVGDNILQNLPKITSNYRVGFGYISTAPEDSKEPCTDCSKSYGFYNIRPLSMDTYRFADGLENIKTINISNNLNAPENGLDAVMQAIVCHNQIGWRANARRLLVFATVGDLHYAGDEKLDNVIVSNDGECHLDTLGFFAKTASPNYPSISQLNQKVRENAISIIFAVPPAQRAVYQNISNHIIGSSYDLLSQNPWTVVGLIRNEYSKIGSSIELKDNSTSHVKITYSSACLYGSTEEATSICHGLYVGSVVSFTAEILVTSCPKDPRDWKQYIQIYPVGIDESLAIDLAMLCSCDCENPDSRTYERHAPQCNLHGTFMCGSCECDEQHYGNGCECSTADIRMSDYGCRPNNMTLVDCSGRGTCVCGKCECEKRSNPEEVISGKYCECDNFSCDRFMGQLCSGVDHGVCDCGFCRCKPGWTGSACDSVASTVN